MTQLTLSLNDKEQKGSAEIIKENYKEYKKSLNEKQIIYFEYWGLEKTSISNELEHNFLVSSKNCIIAYGIGDIDECIEDVKKELIDTGYTNIEVIYIFKEKGEFSNVY